jgi:CRISPR-associated protein Cas2
MHYLIAYDVADPRRLRRVARLLERRAVRCQKSVFLFRGDAAAVAALLDQAAKLLAVRDDVLQAWPLAAGATALSRGQPLPVTPAGVVLAPRRALFVARPPEPEGPP